MEPVTPSRRGINRFAGRHPVATLFGVGIGLSYLLIFVWGLAYAGVLPGGDLADRLGIAPGELAAALATVVLFATTLYVTWAADGAAGIRTLVRRIFHWRVHPGWWAAVLLALPALTVGISVLMGDQLKPVELPGMILTQLGLLAVSFLLINLWEESAWTGVYQTRLERRHNLFAVAALAAVPFALVHLPLQFFEGAEVTVVGLAVAFAVYFVFGVLVRSMFATFLRGTGDSILLVALLHAVFNRSSGSDGIVAAVVDGDTRMLALPIAVVIVTAVVAIVFRRRMTRAHRHELDERWATREEVRREDLAAVR
jgi:uncharacterized protein